MQCFGAEEAFLNQVVEHFEGYLCRQALQCGDGVLRVTDASGYLLYDQVGQP